MKVDAKRTLGRPGGGPVAADYGDAPDGAPACEGGPVIVVDPALYPTLVPSANALAGRSGPYHLPPSDPADDYWFDVPPTYEATPFQPTCDWLSPPCDEDDATVVLCLDGPCSTGVLAFPGPTCNEWIAAPFGVTPTTTGYWIYEVNRGATASGPAYVNVAVDWDLDAAYGSAPGEWVVADSGVTAPAGGSQVAVTAPFPVLTLVTPCAPNPLGWCIEPFWSRFHVSDETMGTTFDGTASLWDGSGRMAGYEGYETEDVVPWTDPFGTHSFTMPPTLTTELFGNLALTLDLGDPNCTGSSSIPVSNYSPYGFVTRQFHPSNYTSGVSIYTELLGLDLAGMHPQLGTVFLRERWDRMSLGKIGQVVANSQTGQFVSGESFFDVYFEIDLPNLGKTLDSGNTPLRIDAGTIAQLPPLGSTYAPPAGSTPLPLYVQGTSQQVGWLCWLDMTLQ
jgi:hypothetical protein